MAARDNWGWRARIGMFIVGNEAVPEVATAGCCAVDLPRDDYEYLCLQRRTSV